MRDIVERLLDQKKQISIGWEDGLGSPGTHFVTDPLCQEAANEIKRLRHALMNIGNLEVPGWDNAPSDTRYLRIVDYARATLEISDSEGTG